MPVVPEDEEPCRWRRWDGSRGIGVGLLGLSTLETPPGRPLPLMGCAHLHKREAARFLLVTVGYGAPDENRAPSEPASPSA